MKSRREEGYILASVLGVLFAVSVVAAALVSASTDSLKRVQRAERDVRERTALDAAFTLVVSQLAIDPQRRAIDIDAGAIDVLDHEFTVRITYESAKLDINLAPPEVIDAALEDHGVSSSVRARLMTNVRRAQDSKTPIRLIDQALLGADADERCIASLLTVFSGREKLIDAGAEQGTFIGRPGGGARVAIELVSNDASAAGLAAVVLMTDDPSRPARVLDWRRDTGIRGKPCGET